MPRRTQRADTKAILPPCPWPADARVSLCHDPTKLLLQQSCFPSVSSLHLPPSPCRRTFNAWPPFLHLLLAARCPHAPRSPPLPCGRPPGTHACLRLSHSPPSVYSKTGSRQNFPNLNTNVSRFQPRDKRIKAGVSVSSNTCGSFVCCWAWSFTVCAIPEFSCWQSNVFGLC